MKWTLSDDTYETFRLVLGSEKFCFIGKVGIPLFGEEAFLFGEIEIFCVVMMDIAMTYIFANLV